MRQLEIANISHSFKNRQVLKHISLDVFQGEIVGLLGPNGAGKTTCFSIIVGLLRPETGNVFLDKRPITALALHQRAQIGLGYLPQNASVFQGMTVVQNLLVAMEIQKIPRQSRWELLEKLLDDFHLKVVQKERASVLSGGERRRLEIARALVAQPQFLLLDEPFAGIDPVTVQDIQTLILRLVRQGNLGVLITDHQVRETLSLCTRSYVLSQGEILAQGNAESISQCSKVRQVYLGENFTL